MDQSNILDQAIINLPQTRESAISKILLSENSKVLAILRDLARTMNHIESDGIIHYHSQYDPWELDKMHQVLLVVTFKLDGSIMDKRSPWISDIGDRSYRYHNKSKIIVKRLLKVGYRAYSYTSYPSHPEKGKHRNEHNYVDIDCQLIMEMGSVGVTLTSNSLSQLKKDRFLYQPVMSSNQSDVICVECNIIMTPREFIDTFKDVTNYDFKYSQKYFNEELDKNIEIIKEKLPQNRQDVISALPEELKQVCKKIVSYARESCLYAHNIAHGRTHQVLKLQYIGITVPYENPLGVSTSNDGDSGGRTKITNMIAAVKGYTTPRPRLGLTPYVISFTEDSSQLRKKYILCPIPIPLDEQITLLNNEGVEVLPKVDEPVTLSDLHYPLIIDSQEWEKLLQEKILLQVQRPYMETQCHYMEQTILFTVEEFMNYKW